MSPTFSISGKSAKVIWVFSKGFWKKNEISEMPPRQLEENRRWGSMTGIEKEECCVSTGVVLGRHREDGTWAGLQKWIEFGEENKKEVDLSSGEDHTTNGEVSLGPVITNVRFGFVDTKWRWGQRKKETASSTGPSPVLDLWPQDNTAADQINCLSTSLSSRILTKRTWLILNKNLKNNEISDKTETPFLES